METMQMQIDHATQNTLEGKIQKLINSFTMLKEKYESLKEENELTLTTNIELEDEKNQWQNEKSHLQQKIAQLEEQLLARTNEVDHLKEANIELEGLTQEVASKIDDLISQVDLNF